MIRLFSLAIVLLFLVSCTSLPELSEIPLAPANSGTSLSAANVRFDVDTDYADQLLLASSVQGGLPSTVALTKKTLQNTVRDGFASAGLRHVGERTGYLTRAQRLSTDRVVLVAMPTGTKQWAKDGVAIDIQLSLRIYDPIRSQELGTVTGYGRSTGARASTVNIVEQDLSLTEEALAAAVQDALRHPDIQTLF